MPIVADDLQGCRVLVTRPVAQAEALCERITHSGGTAVRLPALAIEALHETDSQQRCQSAANYDWLIFISRNAVEQAFTCLPAPLPETLRLAAIGQATATALSEQGVENTLLLNSPSGTSESLLTSAELANMQGQHVLIVRGQNGREQLAETLRARGAQVDYADLYRRVRPQTSPGELSRVLDAGIDILTITSGETLDNLLAMAVEEQRDITSLPLVVMSERLRVLARERGFTDTVIIATEASDEGIVEAIRQWREMVTTE